jgi:hypothetical protein
MLLTVAVEAELVHLAVLVVVVQQAVAVTAARAHQLIHHGAAQHQLVKM